MMELNLLERLAKIEHEQWRDWATTIMNKEVISPERKKRWERLVKTDYSNLTEEEKEQDRKYAKQALEAVVNHIDSRIGSMSKEDISEIVTCFTALIQHKE